MKKVFSATIAVCMMLPILLSGCIGLKDSNFYIDLSEKHIQLLDMEAIYGELLSIIKPDNNELFMTNNGLECRLAQDGYIEHLSGYIYAIKDNYVYQYLVVYLSPIANEIAQIRIQAPQKHKYEESIFALPVSVIVNMRHAVRGIGSLPWSSIFTEYRVGSPVGYGLNVSVCPSSDSPALSDTTRYFLLTDNGHDEVDAGLCTSPQHYRLDITSGYPLGYDGTRLDHRLIFFVPLNGG
ncbi:MAG: hypothetical protein FWE97_00065 [Dehalococcoidia bacterium]|nr:hypothetical protein [Dehalococcoidia bacterium]